MYRVLLSGILAAVLWLGGGGMAMAQNPAFPPGVAPLTLDEERFPNMQHVFDQLSPELQQEMREEAQRAHDVCSRHATFATFKDCDCIGLKYIDARIILGPDVPFNNMINHLSRECPNIPRIAGTRFSMCMEQARMNGMEDARAEEMCQCVGNGVARRYERSPTNSVLQQSNMFTNAMRQCGYIDFLVERSRAQEAQRQNPAWR